MATRVKFSVHLPGRLQGTWCLKSRYAGPGKCNGWFAGSVLLWQLKSLGVDLRLEAEFPVMLDDAGAFNSQRE